MVCMKYISLDSIQMIAALIAGSMLIYNFEMVTEWIHNTLQNIL
jgi:hypothetical protein